MAKDELDFLDETHTLQTDIFRESNEQFSEAVKKDESLVSMVIRQFYLLIALGFGASFGFKAWLFSYELLPIFEDTQDLMLFNHVKRLSKNDKISDKPGAFWLEFEGNRSAHQSVMYLMNCCYKSDLYTVEGRTT